MIPVSSSRKRPSSSSALDSSKRPRSSSSPQPPAPSSTSASNRPSPSSSSYSSSYSSASCPSSQHQSPSSSSSSSSSNPFAAPPPPPSAIPGWTAAPPPPPPSVSKQPFNSSHSNKMAPSSSSPYSSSTSTSSHYAASSSSASTQSSSTSASQNTLPSSWNFPGTPYPSQIDFMKSLYKLLNTTITQNNNKTAAIGVFESPTGTGKSLALLCGAFTWLLQNPFITSPSALQPSLASWNIRNPNKEKLELAIDSLSLNPERLRSSFVNDDDVNDILANPSSSDDESSSSSSNSDSNPEKSSSSKQKRPKWNKWNKRENLIDQSVQALPTRRIIYASRTHSQLAQFVQEVSSAFPNTRLVVLGSRNHTCINPLIKAAPQGPSEACQDLAERARSKAKRAKSLKAPSVKHLTLKLDEDPEPDLPIPETISSSTNAPDHYVLPNAGCAFLPKASATPHEGFSAQRNVMHRLLTSSSGSIEDAVTLGSDASVCPYFASRRAISYAQIIAVPYPSLLSDTTRASLGIPLKGSIILIDEAHNVSDTLLLQESVSLTYSAVSAASDALSAYRSRYNSVLGKKSQAHIQHLSATIHGLMKLLVEIPSDSDTVLPINSSWVFHNIKTGPIIAWADEKRLAAKVRPTTPDGPRRPLQIILNFMSWWGRMDSAAARVRLTFNAEGEKCAKFFVLSASKYMEPILKEAEAVVFAGGTLGHPSQFLADLVHPIPSTTSYFKCGHVISPSNLMVTRLTRLEGSRLAWTHAERTPAMARALWTLLRELAPIVPGGIIVFFPSYSAAEWVLEQWSSHPALSMTSILAEERGGDVETLMAGFASLISRKQSGILLCVMGGRLSEGINFKDSMGRLAIVAGIPYPNFNDPEVKARREGSIGGEAALTAAVARSVNQSIGRVLRHKNDFAAIIFADYRYNEQEKRSWLPEWMHASATAPPFSDKTQLHTTLKSFFSTHTS